MKQPIFYDTETTGIRLDEDRIVEIAAYNPVTQKSFCSFVNPMIPIPADATRVHHISDEMVRDAPTFATVGKDFIEFCGEDAILIAHNNDGFDVHILRNELKRHQVMMPEWKFIDTLKWARRYRPDLPRHSLQFLREIYGVAMNNAHRALDDVVVLHEIFSKMIDDLTFEQVLERLAQKKPPKALTEMPFGKHQGVPLEKVPKNYIQWLSESGSLEKESNLALKESLIKLGLVPQA